jgi:basic membrane protein A
MSVLFTVVGVLAFSPLLFLLALFIYAAASGGSRTVILGDLPEGLTVGDVANTEGVAGTAPAGELLRQLLGARRSELPVLDTEGRIVGRSPRSRSGADRNRCNMLKTGSPASIGTTDGFKRGLSVWYRMSRNPRRRTVLKGLGSIGVAGALAGCGGDGGDSGDGSGDGSDGGDGGDGGGSDGGDGGDGGSENINVGMVYATGGLGDQSFNDMAHVGIQEAEAEFGVTYQNAEPDAPGDVGELQRRFARSSSPNFELICCIGFVQATDLKTNAQEFPDQDWTIVDSVVKDDDGNLIDNVANYVFREHEGSFQVGVLAGMLTGMDYSHGGGTTNPDESMVGFVGGQEIPLIEKFEAGYAAGVDHADAEIQFESAYAGDWNDPATGQEIATSMYDDGADVVYHAAGGTGAGVFEAAQAEGRYAIGVDNDQSVSASEFSDVIVASMIKRVNRAVFESVSGVIDGNFRGGQVNDLGLAEDGVGAVIGQDFEGELPGDITSELETTRQGIIDGDIDVPTTMDDV